MGSLSREWTRLARPCPSYSDQFRAVHWQVRNRAPSDESAEPVSDSLAPVAVAAELLIATSILAWVGFHPLCCTRPLQFVLMAGLIWLGRRDREKAALGRSVDRRGTAAPPGLCGRADVIAIRGAINMTWPVDAPPSRLTPLRLGRIGGTLRLGPSAGSRGPWGPGCRGPGAHGPRCFDGRRKRSLPRGAG
jgi:hypothetical protein